MTMTMTMKHIVIAGTSGKSLFVFIILSSISALSMSFSITRCSNHVKHHRKKLAGATSSSSLSATVDETTFSRLVPRAAVSVVVRWCDSKATTSTIEQQQHRHHHRDASMNTSAPSKPRWLLVQRGKEPNRGMWSFPGGKIDVGEGTLDAAKRELFEETRLIAQCYPIETQIPVMNDANYSLKWHNFGAFACSDSIHYHPTQRDGSIRSADDVGFHYVISQCFAEVIAPSMPIVSASDDAADVRWWSDEEIELAEESGKVTQGVRRIVERAEILYSKGLLNCDE